MQNKHIIELLSLVLIMDYYSNIIIISNKHGPSVYVRITKLTKTINKRKNCKTILEFTTKF